MPFFGRQLENLVRWTDVLVFLRVVAKRFRMKSAGDTPLPVLVRVRRGLSHRAYQIDLFVGHCLDIRMADVTRVDDHLVRLSHTLLKPFNGRRSLIPIIAGL
jgi:hypothetical protein